MNILEKIFMQEKVVFLIEKLLPMELSPQDLKKQLQLKIFQMNGKIL